MRRPTSFSSPRRDGPAGARCGAPTWHTTTIYGGNFTTTVPPTGATAQSLLTDARGRVTHLYEYHTGVPADPVNDPASDYSDTSYTYYPDGNRASETDAAGNTWSWQYDLLGRETSATDPDSGTGTTAYDNAGQMLSTTDFRGKQVSYSYDADGRVRHHRERRQVDGQPDRRVDLRHPQEGAAHLHRQTRRGEGEPGEPADR